MKPEIFRLSLQNCFNTMGLCGEQFLPGGGLSSLHVLHIWEILCARVPKFQPGPRQRETLPEDHV